MRKLLKDKQRGFSIIEVVISLFIIGITLLLFQVASQAVVLNKYNRYKEIALRVADTKLQELRTTPYASLPSSGSFSNSQLSSIPQGAGTITVTQEDTGLSLVEVTVTWRNPQSTKNQQVKVSTYIWQGGLGK